MPGDKLPPLSPSDRGPQNEAALPNPDLNPLTNPTLGRNLGKWAQVYFTNPPEKRDDALSELLRELETTPQVEQATEVPGVQGENGGSSNGSSGQTLTSNSTAAITNLSCPQCERNNAPEQWFCGYCGFPLRGTAPSVASATQAVEGPPVRPSQFPTSRMSEAQHTDLQWLRERSLAGFRSSNHASHPFRSLLLIVFVLGLGGLAYHYWHGRAAGPATTGSTQPRASQDAKFVSPAANMAQPDPLAAAPIRQRPPASERRQPQERNSSKTLALKAASAPTTSRKPASPSTAGLPVADEGLPLNDKGERELAIAETFLRSGGSARDPGEAAKWLWKSVAKHNTTALVRLAGLYKRGDGVSKSCDQAQLLLVAAAKRGSVQAGQELKRLQTSGCR